MCINLIESTNDDWIEQKSLNVTRRKEEEGKYEERTKGERGRIFKLIHEANEAIIMLIIYKKEMNEMEKLTLISIQMSSKESLAVLEQL